MSYGVLWWTVMRSCSIKIIDINCNWHCFTSDKTINSIRYICYFENLKFSNTVCYTCKLYMSLHRCFKNVQSSYFLCPWISNCNILRTMFKCFTILIICILCNFFLFFAEKGMCVLNFNSCVNKLLINLTFS